MNIKEEKGNLILSIKVLLIYTQVFRTASSENETNFDFTDGTFNQDILIKDLLNPQNGSDKGMYNKELFQGDIVIVDPKSAISNPSKLWPNGVVVFKTADDVGCPDSRQCKIIMYAMEIYHRNTCVRFKEWTGEKDFVEIFYNNGDSGACWSLVGKEGGRQRLSLGYRCWYLGIAVHELGHALGFWHEMNRPDRDNHIIIHWRNIQPGFASSFAKNPSWTVNYLGEAFDLKSIMMYDEYAFSKDAKSPTIETKSGETIGPIWRKRVLSQSDIRRVQKLYQCDGNKAKKGFPQEFHCNFKNHTCGFRNRGRTIWKWRGIPNSGEYIFAVGNSTTSKSELISVNFHVPEETKLYTNGCLTVSYFLSEGSSIQVNQETLYSVTDTSRGVSKKLWNSTDSKGGWSLAKINLNMRKPYRIVFVPDFTINGIVALSNINIALASCAK